MDANSTLLDTLVDQSLLMPSQHSSRPALPPEHDLLAAILTDAIKVMRNGAMTKHSDWGGAKICAHEYHETKRWFASESARPYGFLYICQHLSLTPEIIRRYVA